MSTETELSAARRPRKWAPIGLVLLLLATGCGGTVQPAQSQLDRTVEAAAISTYGHGIGPELNVVLQPDVVSISGGPSIIRSVSGDGMTLHLDGRAPGLDKLRSGMVLLLTSRAVGRVMEMRDEGDGRVVTLAPVMLTEIIKDGTLQLDHDFDLESMSMQVVPQRIGAIEDDTESPDQEEPSQVFDVEPSSSVDRTSRSTIQVPAIQLAAMPAAPISRDSGSGGGNWPSDTALPPAE